MAVDMFLDFSAGPARGQSPITVVGESQDKTYPKTIEVKAFDLGVENATTIGSAAAGAGTGKTQFKPFKVSHVVDSASPPLFQALAEGAHFPTVKFYLRTSGTANAFVIYTLTMVFITNIESALDTTITTGSNLALETVQMVYGAMQMSYQPGGANGQPTGQPLVSNWNQVTNNTNPTIPGN